MARPLKYSKVKVIKITETQYKTLKKMKSLGVPVSKFIRDAIKEKIEREHEDLTTKKNKDYCPFSNGTIKI